MLLPLNLLQQKKHSMKETRIDSDSLREAIGRLNAALRLVRQREDAQYMFACREGWAWVGRHSADRIAWVRIGVGFEFAPFLMDFGDIQRLVHRFCFVQDDGTGDVFIDGRKYGAISASAEMTVPEPVARLDCGLFYSFVLKAEEALLSKPGECFIGIRDGQMVARDRSTLIWEVDVQMQAYAPGFDFFEFTIEEITATSSPAGEVRIVRLGEKCGLMFDDLFFVRNPVGVITSERLSWIKTHKDFYVINSRHIVDSIKLARRQHKGKRFFRLRLTLAETWVLENEAGEVLAEGKCSSMSVGAKPVQVSVDGFRLERALRYLGFHRSATFRCADFGSLSNIVAISLETFERPMVFVCPLYDGGEV